MPVGALPPDMDALNRHPLPYWGSWGIIPGKILKFCAQNHAILFILAVPRVVRAQA